MKPKRFELSDQTAAMVNYLREHAKGAIVTYRELGDIAKMKIIPSTPRLTSARNILQRDHAQVWACVRPGIGVKRLNDVEIAEALPRWWMNGARNKLRRGGDQAEVVELTSLDLDQQAKFAVDCIQRELSLESLSKATRRKMEKLARGTSNDLPAFTAVEWAISLSPKGKK